MSPSQMYDGGSSSSSSNSSSSNSSSSNSSCGDADSGSESWQSVLRGLSIRTPPVRVLLPCAGWDAPCQALQALGIPHTVAGAWETDMSCAPVLRKVHGIRADKDLPHQFHIGRTGDITKVCVQSLPDADILVSGPPCPPFSTIGKRRCFTDRRANVLMAVVKWIFHLATMSLRCFVIENVAGMMQRPSPGGMSPAALIVNRLKGRLKQWHIECLVMDSGCTAQRRKRIYIVGYRRGPSASLPLQKALPWLPRQTLADIVDRRAPNTPLSALSTGQRSNLEKYKHKLKRELRDRRFRGQVAAVEIDRDMDKGWGARVAIGQCMCLRARSDRQFLLSLGEGSPSVQRLLTPAEAAALQGMRPEIVPKGFPRHRVFHGLGNAMTVPVVAQVLYVGIGRAFGMRLHGDSGEDSGEDSDGGSASDGMRSSSSDGVSSSSSDGVSPGQMSCGMSVASSSSSS